jgi:hypothetical protein
MISGVFFVCKHYSRTPIETGIHRTWFVERLDHAVGVLAPGLGTWLACVIDVLDRKIPFISLPLGFTTKFLPRLAEQALERKSCPS